MRRSTFMVMWLLGALAMSCSAGGPPAGDEATVSPGLFTGALEGSDAKIALVRNDAAWAAYVCGGASSMSSLTGWFQGDLARGGGAVDARSDGKHLSAEFGAEAATGTVTVDGGEAVRFEASVVPEGVAAGLYQVVSSGCRTGLIIPPPGHGEPQGVYCADVGPSGERARLFEQVTPVAPIRLGDAIVTARVLGARSQIIQLEKVALPLDST